MIIIIGLGNPGGKFKNTRHNVGFMVLDKFAEKNNFPEFKLQKKSEALISENVIEGEKIVLAKPQTFMNNSDKAVRSLIKNLKIEKFIVVHDDVDLPVGKIKIVKDRGSAGHKGVESIIKTVGNENLIRIRIGIEGKKDVEAMDVVLKKFSPDEQKILNETIIRTAQALDFLIKNVLEKAMNEFN